MTRTIIGLFPYVNPMLSSVRRLRGYDIEEMTLLSPVPIVEEIDLQKKRSDALRFFTFFGGLAGAFGGALFAIGTSIMYPLPRGGRPIMALPPILLISFETLILIGILATLAGFLITAKLPSFKERPYHYRIGEDRFGLLIKTREERVEIIEKILREGGAEEIIRYED